MQIYFLHFNKCAGTTAQHFFRTLVPEKQFLYAEFLPVIEPLALRHFSFVHDTHFRAPHSATDPRPLLVTVLREPISRLTSEWRMIVRWTEKDLDDPQKKVYHQAKAGLRTFLELRDPLQMWSFFNPYAKALVANDGMWKSALETGAYLDPGWQESIFAVAIERLKSFHVVALSTSVDYLMTEMASRMFGGLEFRPPPRLNVTPEATPIPDCGPEDKELLESYLAVDAKLWQWAVDNCDAITNDTFRKHRTLGGSSVLDFHQSICASNVYPREVNQAKASVWTVGDDISTFWLTAEPKHPYFLSIDITNYISPTQIDALQVFFNGVPLIMNRDWQGGAVVLWARLEAASIGPRNSLDMRSIGLRPLTLSDTRLLGVEVSRIGFIREPLV